MQLVLFVCFIGLCSCNGTMQQSRYYRYYVGSIKIENPVLVEFEKQVDMWFVCPDSALYCCNDSDWLYRDDVFPYRSVVEVGEPIMTYFPRKQLGYLKYVMYGYSAYYEYGKMNNHIVHHFYYDLSTFECYMEATDINMFDNLVEDDIDYSDADDSYVSKRSGDFHGKNQEYMYRLVVRDKYNIYQIWRLKMKYPKPVLEKSIESL